MIAPLLYFWQSHPALLYGIAFMLGVFCYFSVSIYFIIPCLFLWFPFVFHAFHSHNRETLKPFFLSLFTFLTAWIYTLSFYAFPSLPPEGLMGMAHVKINSISLQPSPFGKNWLYRCEIEQFFPENVSQSIVSSLPCTIMFPTKEMDKAPPTANQDYWVAGKLKQNKNQNYVLKVSSKAYWTPIEGTWSLAAARYSWKKKISRWIDSQFSQQSPASFLAGLVTGEFDDYWMRQQFARFGLQHLLAISGFHFAIIAAFLSLSFRLFLSMRLRTVGLLVCLGGYCFFLGPQPSILRAWIMCSLTLLGGLLEKQSTALNSLGLALMIVLGYNPHLCQELGFQLSFAITVAILLFYQPAQTLCDYLLPKRNLSIALQMNRLDQHAYCVLSFFRQGLALTLAVNAFALPFTLYYFQQFPWMSLLYNLFFPLLASASICLLLLGGVFSFIPFIGAGIHSINDSYTYYLLQLTYQAPIEMDLYLRISSIHPFWFILYLCCMSLGGIIWKEKIHSQSNENKEFLFI